MKVVELSPRRGLTGQAASARAAVPLVSDSGQAAGTTGNLGFDRAQRVTTGCHDLGCMLASVDVRFHSIPADDPVQASIWAGPGSATQTVAQVGATLANPASLGPGVNTFTASPGGIDLTASTDRFVVVDLPAETSERPFGRGYMVHTASDDGDAGAAAGWSIGDTRVTLPRLPDSPTLPGRRARPRPPEAPGISSRPAACDRFTEFQGDTPARSPEGTRPPAGTSR